MMVSKIRAPIPGHHSSGSMLNFGRVNDGSFVKKAPLNRLAVLFLNIGLHFLGGPCEFSVYNRWFKIVTKSSCS